MAEQSCTKRIFVVEWGVPVSKGVLVCNYNALFLSNLREYHHKSHIKTSFFTLYFCCRQYVSIFHFDVIGRKAKITQKRPLRRSRIKISQDHQFLYSTRPNGKPACELLCE